MNNEQIIIEKAIELYGEDAVNALLEKGIEMPLHTLQGWKARGYKVKKGEHAIAEVKLWKKKRNSLGNLPSDFYLCKTSLFSEEQVLENNN